MNNRFGQMLRVLDLAQRENTQDPMELALHLRLPENSVRRYLRELREAGVLPILGAANDGASTHPPITTADISSAPSVIAARVLARLGVLPANEAGPASGADPAHAAHVRQQVYQCISERRVLSLEYRREGEDAFVRREVEPLAQTCRDGEWSFLAYCRLRQDIRTFHHARASNVVVTDRFFEPHRGVSLERFIQRRKARDSRPSKAVRLGHG